MSPEVKVGRPEPRGGSGTFNLVCGCAEGGGGGGHRSLALRSAQCCFGLHHATSRGGGQLIAGVLHAPLRRLRRLRPRLNRVLLRGLVCIPPTQDMAGCNSTLQHECGRQLGDLMAYVFNAQIRIDAP